MRRTTEIWLDIHEEISKIGQMLVKPDSPSGLVRLLSDLPEMLRQLQSYREALQRAWDLVQLYPEVDGLIEAMQTALSLDIGTISVELPMKENANERVEADR